MLRNMVTSLLKYEQIETTDVKAKALRPVAEKMITLAKRGDLHARRQALAYIQDKETTHRLFGDLKDRYLERQGGYVRIIKKGVRKGDGAAISIIQLLPIEEGKKSGKRKVKKSKTKKASPDKAGDVTAGKEKKGESKPKREKAAKKEEKK
jgi:large subunit ribosomal protein L17